MRKPAPGRDTSSPRVDRLRSDPARGGEYRVPSAVRMTSTDGDGLALGLAEGESERDADAEDDTDADGL